MTTKFPTLPEVLQRAEDDYDTCSFLWERKSEIQDSRILDILNRYAENPSLSPGQSRWLGTVAKGIKASEPLYGDFKAIEVMFMIAGDHMKTPKIRLVTEDDIFVQLNFIQDRLWDPQSGAYVPNKYIKVFRDGWAGHGRRKFIATIREGVVTVRWHAEWTLSIMDLLQAFSLDPAKVAKASAAKLGACPFCAQRLSDPESKSRGYGPVCAEHYQLPWGDRDEAALAYEAKVADLDVSQLL